METIQQIWPKWKGVEILGQGGFGTVYKAKKESFLGDEYSAIKIVKIPHEESEIDEMISSGFSNENIKEYYYQSVVTLVDEIKLMGKLKSASHIVTIEDYEVVENKNGLGFTVYIRMELLTNITKYFRNKEITSSEVIKLATHILSALEFCHAQNIVHRDIKPANIFISEFGEYKLGDFGVSREVEKTNATMSQKGTKSYMAPEMIRMEKYGKNVDLYALGLTMYELLNHGRMPFLPPFPQMFYVTEREAAMERRLKGEEFPNIEGIGELNKIIKKACHPNPQQRYQTATQMKKDLLDLTGEKTVEMIQVDIVEEKTMVGEDNLFNQEETIINHEKTLFAPTKEKTNIQLDDETTMGIFSTHQGPMKNQFFFEDTVGTTPDFSTMISASSCDHQWIDVVSGIQYCPLCEKIECIDTKQNVLFQSIKDGLDQEKKNQIIAFGILQKIYIKYGRETAKKIFDKTFLGQGYIHQFYDKFHPSTCLTQGPIEPGFTQDYRHSEYFKKDDMTLMNARHDFIIHKNEKIYEVFIPQNSENMMVFTEKRIYLTNNRSIEYFELIDIKATDSVFGNKFTINQLKTKVTETLKLNSALEISLLKAMFMSLRIMFNSRTSHYR